MTVSDAATRARERFAGDEVRLEARDKVSGRTLYAADVRAENALWAAFVESPHPHAKIRAIDVRAARSMRGVRAVLTAAEVDNAHFGRVLCDWPVLAIDTVRFIGDRVAAVAADTREAAEEAARAIAVDYEVLPAVFDVHAALAGDSPIIHPRWDNYTNIAEHAQKRSDRSHLNVYASKTIRTGDTDLEPHFARAYRVFEHTFKTARQLAGFIEPRSTLVWIEDTGIVHLHTPNKGPYAFRKHFAHAVGLPEAQIVIEPVTIGGDFGGKGLTVDELPCYYLARATKRPVRYTATYAEELRRGPTRHASQATLRSAVDAEGRLLAHVSSVTYDGGAYAATKPIPSLLPGNAYGSVPYHVPHARLDIRGVYTNTLPAAHVRGPADVQTFFAWEQHIDRIARAMNIDPLALRLTNIVRDGQQIVTGETMRRPMGADVLKALSDACEPLPAGDFGRGISIIGAHTGSGKTAVKLQLFRDGRVEVIVGTVDQGAGLPTVVRRVVAATLGVADEVVNVRRGSTLETLPDQGSGHSRVTHIVGRAAFDAAEQMRVLIEQAHVNGESFAEDARRVCANEPHVEVIGRFVSDHGEQVPGDLTFGAYAVDVHVDRATGAIAVVNVVFVMDIGQIISPVAHQGQIEGGFLMGLGSALMEEVTINEDGRVMTPSLGEYKLPTMRDIPPLRTLLLQAPLGDGPYGARMVGELCNVGVPAAIVNAVDDAVGVRLTHFPVRSEDVFTALAERTA